MFLVGKLLNVKPYTRLENGIFLIMGRIRRTFKCITTFTRRIRTMLPPVQQTFNSLSFKKKLLHRWCNSPDFVQPICRLVGLWHLRDGCHHTIRYSYQFLFLRQHQNCHLAFWYQFCDGHYQCLLPD